MDCDRTQEHLSAWLDGELPAESAAEVRAHLTACTACRSELEELRATVALVSRLPLQPAPADLAEGIERAIARPDRPPGSQPAAALRKPQGGTERGPGAARRRRGPWSHVLALAASILLAVGIGALVWIEVVRPGPPLAFHGAQSDPTGPEGEAPAPAASPPARGLASTSAGKLNKSAPAAPKQLELHRMNETAPGEQQELALATNGEHRLEPVGDLDAGHVRKRERAAPSKQAPAGTETYNLEIGGGAFGRSEAAKDLKTAPEPVAPGPEGIPEAEAMPDSLVDFSVLPTDQHADPAPGRTVTVLSDKAAEVQHEMNRAAQGRAGREDLEQVATGGNLARADHQLILYVPSAEAGRRKILGLFAANDWRPLAEREPAEAGAAEPTGRDAATEGRQSAAQTRSALAETAPAAGYYFRAAGDGGETWVVVTDRDSLSRFGTQLARAEDLAVAYGSSREFAPIRKLQDELRSVAPGGASGESAWDEEAAEASSGPAQSAPEEGDAEATPATAATAAPAEPATDDRARAPEDESEEATGVARGPAKGDEGEKLERPVEEAAQRGREKDRRRFFLWSEGAIREVSALPEGQVLLVIRVRPKPGDAEATAGVKADRAAESESGPEGTAPEPAAPAKAAD